MAKPKLPTDQLALDALAAKAKDELARRDLPTYVDVVHSLPTYPHMKEWAEALMDETTGNLVIICPPGHGKTQWISVFFSCWYIGRNPDKHVILVSNTADQAEKPSVAVRNTIQFSREYQRVFPHVRADQSKGWGMAKWYVQRKDVADKDATMFAVGVGGPIIGARGNLLILDDVNDQENTSSETQRNKVCDWVSQSAFSRLVRGGRTIMVQTRWHELDLAARFLNNPEWTVIHMPAIGYWGPDTALCPEIRTTPELESIKREKGSLIFEKMYQGNPTVPEGNILKRHWWQRIPETQMPPIEQMEIVVQAWDTAFKTGEENDYCVCLTMARYKGSVLILRMFKKKLEWPDLVKKSRELYAMDKPRIVLIEDKASGQSLCQQLRSAVQPMIPVMGFKADSDHLARVEAFTAYPESKRVFLPTGPMSDEWVEEFITEMAGFPSAAHDDIVMAWVGGMQYLTAGDKFERLDSGVLVGTERPGEEAVPDDWSELPGADSLAEFLRELN